MARIFKPPIIALLYFLIALGLSFLFSELKIILSPYKFIGIFIILLGVILMFCALKLFRRKNTTKDPWGKPTTLVISGPFLISRNPIYLGITFVLLGLAVYLGDLLMFLSPIAFILTINYLFIPREEKVLGEIIGKDYLDYKKKVRKWL